MHRAFIFDMDGTLIDTEILWVEAVEILLKNCGIPLAREEATEIVYGVSWPDVYATLIERYPHLDALCGEISMALRPIFLDLRDSRDVRIHSSIALLERLSSDYPVCIVSGSSRDNVVAGIALTGIESYLRFWLSEADYHPGKPHPACYHLAARDCGCPRRPVSSLRTRRWGSARRRPLAWPVSRWRGTAGPRRIFPKPTWCSTTWADSRPACWPKGHEAFAWLSCPLSWAAAVVCWGG